MYLNRAYTALHSTGYVDLGLGQVVAEVPTEAAPTPAKKTTKRTPKAVKEAVKETPAVTEPAVTEAANA